MTESFLMPVNNHRLGMHYFPDKNHFRQSDLDIWLPEMKALGIQWLTINASPAKAIPEPFIRRLIESGIEPVLHFKMNLIEPINYESFKMMLQSYEKWGVRYIVLFDKPNSFSQWGDKIWGGTEIVSSFLQAFLPLAEIALEFNFNIGFPPLEPGGNYWDTTFLRQSLKSLKEMGYNEILAKLFLTAYGWAGNRPFDWGMGGPEQWPGTRPYFTPDGEEDQFGLRIFDWYNAQSAAILGDPLPLMLTACGSLLNAQTDKNTPAISLLEHSYRNLQIARLLARQYDGIPEGATRMEIPENILSGNFWLLSSRDNSKNAEQAWFQPNGERLPIVEKMKAWVKSSKLDKLTRVSLRKNLNIKQFISRQVSSNLIEHYLYIPLDLINQESNLFKKLENFLSMSRPTIGFSIEEAKHAKRVTILAGKNTNIQKEKKELLRHVNYIDQINLNGTVVAN